jgi:hypothetical protein
MGAGGPKTPDEIANISGNYATTFDLTYKQNNWATTVKKSTSLSSSSTTHRNIQIFLSTIRQPGGIYQTRPHQTNGYN